MDKGDGLHDATEAAESSGEIVGSDEGRAPVVGSDGERLQRHLRELELGDETASFLRDRQTLIPGVSTEQSISEQKYEELRQRVAQVERELEQAKREREQAKRELEQAEREREQAKREREQAEREREQVERRVAQVERELEQAKRERDKNAFATNFHSSDNMDQILEKIDSFGI